MEISSRDRGRSEACGVFTPAEAEATGELYVKMDIHYAVGATGPNKVAGVKEFTLKKKKDKKKIKK